VPPTICRLLTVPVNAGPVASQNGFQLVPSHCARLSAFASPPAFWKLPPAYTLPPDTAMSSTLPPEICDVDELTAPQLLPFQVAILSALATPPASVKSPPT
jgi:hypothetical protein